MARPIVVLPVPGGPLSKIPFGGSIPIASNNSGCFNGNSTNSLTYSNYLSIPPKSEYPTNYFLLLSSSS